MSFLPPEYKAPSTNSSYMKILEGENKFRILTRPILGWEDWLDKKPIRFRFENKPAQSVDPSKPVRHFWAMVVYCYNDRQIKILHLTQASIRNRIQALSQDKDWGDVSQYDIKIVKTGSGIDTEYEVNPLPHKELSPEIIDAFNEKPCNLEALFDNGDPFDKNHRVHTPGIFIKITENSRPTENEVDELCEMLSCCSDDYQKEVNKKLTDSGKKIIDLPYDSFKRLLDKTREMRNVHMALNNEDVPF